MGRLSSKWVGRAVLIVTLTVGLVDAQSCAENDANGCELFKYTSCPSNVIDVGFILDQSGSMGYGIDCSESSDENCPKIMDCPETIIDQGNCRRSDIMRIVFRQVMKRLFNRFSRPCYEYKESNQYKVTGQECKDALVQTTVIWWSSEVNRIDDFRTFQRDGEDYWSKQLNGYFFSDGTRDESKWIKKNQEWFIEDDAIDTYFDTIFYADDEDSSDSSDIDEGDTAKPKWPRSSGRTYPSKGVKKWQDLIEGIEDSNDRSFPTFLMTDGVISSGDNEDFKQASIDLRDISSGVETYGLGLTGNTDLKMNQTTLYDANDWIYSTNVGSGTVEHFFASQDDSNQVIDAIFKIVTEGCSTCYQLNDEVQCTIGDEIPIFTGFNDPDRNVNETQVVASEDGQVEDDPVGQVSSDKYVRFDGDDTVYTIKKGTELCQSYDQNYPEVKFVEFSDDGSCKCCSDRGINDPACLCRYEDALRVSTELVGAQQLPRLVNLYPKNSRLYGQIMLAPDDFTTSESTADDPFAGDGDGEDSGDDGSGGSGGDGGSNDPATDPSTGQPSNNDDTQPTGTSGATVVISSSALLVIAVCLVSL